MKKLLIPFSLLFSLTLFGQCPGFNLNPSFMDNSCFNMGDGFISSNPTGGIGPYTYQLYDSGNNLVGANSTGDFTSLIADNYKVVVFDQGNACYDTTAVTISEPAPISISNAVSNVTCNGICDGFIDATVFGGTPGYTYEWYFQTTPIGTTEDLSAICAGSYQLFVTDANGCTADITEVVTEPTAISVAESIVHDSGIGDGSITIAVTGGTVASVYSYSWTGPSGFTSSSQNITGLSPGSYSLIVNDDNGCAFNGVYTIVSTNVTSTYSTMDPFCAGDASGGISVYPNGGTGSYNFEITDQAYNVIYSSTTNTDYYTLMAGAYYYILTDLGNASADTNYFELFDPGPVTVIETVVDETCGQCNGAIFLNVSGGTAPYTASWSNGSTTFNLGGLCSGSYTVDLYDANGCYVQYTYTVTSVGTAFTATTAATNATCSGNCNGELTVTPTGGTMPYNYLWDDPTAQTSNTAVGLCSGIYSVEVTDGTGCTMTFTDTINDNTAVYGTVSSTTNTSCLVCDGSVTVTGAGGVGPYTYVNVITQDTNTTGIFDSLCSNVHYVEVIDANGCSGIVTYTIIEESLPGINLTGVITNETAGGANDGAIDLSHDTVAYPNLSFNWSPINATTEDLYNLSGGTYYCNIVDSASGGCTFYSGTVATIPANAYISGRVIIDNNSDCALNSGDTFLQNIQVVISDGTNSYNALTNTNGYYYVLVPNGSYTVTPQLPAGFTFNCSSSQNVVVNGVYVSNVNFYATAPPFEDLCSYSYGWGFVPGFDAYISAYMVNNGNVTSDGELAIVIPAGTIYNYSSQTPTSIVGDTIYYQVNNLAPGGYFQAYVSVNIPTWFQLGDVVEYCSYAVLQGGGIDINPACNDDCNYDVVVGSYDPNDKSVQPMGIDTPGYIETDEDEFVYTIRFQNTGTAPAVNVYITDTLDAMLDPTSMQVLSQSHNMNIEFPQNNVVKFRFDNIMLPDSNSNEPESHGFVQFKINTLATPQLTETVENTANIYFDFNEPVITNTTLNTYADFSSVTEQQILDLDIYPNPASDELFIVSNEVSSYKIIDINGKVILTGSIQPQESINISELSSGMYFVEVSSAIGLKRTKFNKH